MVHQRSSNVSGHSHERNFTDGRVREPKPDHMDLQKGAARPITVCACLVVAPCREARFIRVWSQVATFLHAVELGLT